MLKARSNTEELGTICVFNVNEEDHRLIVKGFGDRVVSLDELKTKRDKVAALLHRDGSQKWSGACVSEFFGWGSSRYAVNVVARLYEQRCGVDRGPCPALVAGGNTPTSAFWAEKCKNPTSPQLLHPLKMGQKVVVNWTGKDLSLRTGEAAEEHPKP